MDAAHALARLVEGNEKFLHTRWSHCDVSGERVALLADEGQHPFAVVVTCSDSRVAPEHVFMQGLGELFVIRVAGNVVGPAELASVYYACEHLGCKLALVMGHTQCGAIAAALGHHHECGCLEPVVAPIERAIEDDKDPYQACVDNVRAGVEKLESCPDFTSLIDGGLRVCGAVYHTDEGRVEFLWDALDPRPVEEVPSDGLAVTQ